MAKRRLRLPTWAPKKRCSACMQLLTKDIHSEMQTINSGIRISNYREKIFESRIEGERQTAHETSLGVARQATEDIQKDQPTRTGGIPNGFQMRCWIGFPLIVRCTKCFAASRTVFIPKSSIVDDNGLIVRSPDALRPLTLCNCDCEITTVTICFALHKCSIKLSTWRSDASLPDRPMTHNIFEVETIALAHTWIFHVLEKSRATCVISQFLRMTFSKKHDGVILA